MSYRTLLALPLALGACGNLGDRATDGCPTGRVCSPDTPNGLAFSGATLSDQPFDSTLHPTVVDGTQVVQLLDAGTGRPMTRPFTALIRGTTVEVLSTDVAHGQVVLSGLAPGSSRLEINAPDGSLYDRITVDGADATDASLRARDELLRPDLDVALLAGTTADVTVALRYFANRVVDEGTALAQDGAPLPDSSWQSARLTAPASGALTLTATLTSGAAFTLPITTAAGADRIELQPRGPLVVGSPDYVCASALVGDAQILGARWTWSTTTDAELILTSDRNCAGVKAVRPGPLPLTVTAAGVTATLTVDATTTARTAPRAIPDTGLGDRAAALALDAD